MIKSISDKEIEVAKKVLNRHVVKDLSKESALETLVFTIASQALPWEQATKLISQLRKVSSNGRYASQKVLTDPNTIFDVAKSVGYRFTKERRFDHAVDYFGKLEGEWWNEILNANEDVREDYSVGERKIDWINRKTFSFWHLCLGGRNLLALDVHVMRQLATSFGVEMNCLYYTPRQRGKTRINLQVYDGEDDKCNGLFDSKQMKGIIFDKRSQKVRVTPNKKDYSRIEEEARELFSKDERFYFQGKLNMALVDSLLWWRGANRGSLNQGQFIEGDCPSDGLPYNSE